MEKNPDITDEPLYNEHPVITNDILHPDITNAYVTNTPK